MVVSSWVGGLVGRVVGSVVRVVGSVVEECTATTYNLLDFDFI